MRYHRLYHGSTVSLRRHTVNKRAARLNLSNLLRLLRVAVVLFALTLTATAIASDPPLPAPAQPIELARYAGDWFVHGYTPLQIPFFSDADARNYKEHYELPDPDTIRMTSAFDTGPANDPRRRSFSFKGDIVDAVLNATWKIWFLWPIGAQYSIIYLDESYSTTIVASGNRQLAWIMSREPAISDTQYSELMTFLQNAGFDPAKFRRVPQNWGQPAGLRSQAWISQSSSH